MEEIINNLNRARLECEKHEKLLMAFCLNPYYALEWRFEVWQEHAKKKELKHGLSFNNQSSFEHTVPLSIIRYVDGDWSHGDEHTYEDLITHVAERYLEQFADEDISDELIDASFNTPEVNAVKEWLMMENLGSWR